MDTNNFRSEFHVAQQSRRDKLRNHLNPYNHHHLPAGTSSFDFSDLPTTARNDYTWETLPTQPNPDHGSWVSVVRNNNHYQNPSCYGEGTMSSVEINPTISVAKPYENQAYHNALQELVAEETGDNPWVGNGNGGGELLLLPTYNDRIGGPTPTDAPRWNGELHSNTQALSLTLSSLPSPKVYGTQLAERSRVLTHQTPGPLGPFTGYATILRSSRFLRPAQMLLEELCCVARPMNFEICEEPDKMEDVRVSGEGACSIGFNERSTEVGWMDSCRPESIHKKSKLLYMQDEVSRKYKQYQQQMQMVVSSFESVEGLGASTPYVSLALKMLSKHFRSLKSAITDQLKSIGNSLGEELSSPNKGGSMLKFFDQSFQKQRGSNNNNSNNMNVLDGQHIWRPQRGLPERAVSILRAWLFDHFLHPYPTDTDKHMLATQTGLTRNQVSNWFINARVRVWKPMVEEIHMLETKGMSEACSEEKTPNVSTECDQGQCSNTVRESKMMDDYSIGDYPIGAGWNQDKRSRIEYGVPTGVVNDGSLLMPASHQTVSLTLGLRQGAEIGQRQQHYGGQFRRDFVG